MKKYKKQCPKCNKDQVYTRADALTRAVKKNTLCNSCAVVKYEKGVLKGVTEEQRLQMRATKAGFSNWEEYLDKYPKKEMYKREVWKYTYRNDLTKFENYDKRGRNGVDGAYQIDHIVSINEGWKSNTPAKKIGNMTNLQMITWEENRRKW